MNRVELVMGRTILVKGKYGLIWALVVVTLKLIVSLYNADSVGLVATCRIGHSKSKSALYNGFPHPFV